jgi:hypothetical protein
MSTNIMARSSTISQSMATRPFIDSGAPEHHLAGVVNNADD